MKGKYEILMDIAIALAGIYFFVAIYSQIGSGAAISLFFILWANNVSLYRSIKRSVKDEKENS